MARVEDELGELDEQAIGCTLQDVATVRAVRRELQPVVDEVAADLSVDPLSDTAPERVQALDAALRSPRAHEGREALRRIAGVLAFGCNAQRAL